MRAPRCRRAGQLPDLARARSRKYQPIAPPPMVRIIEDDRRDADRVDEWSNGPRTRVRHAPDSLACSAPGTIGIATLAEPWVVRTRGWTRVEPASAMSRHVRAIASSSAHGVAPALLSPCQAFASRAVHPGQRFRSDLFIRSSRGRGGPAASWPRSRSSGCCGRSPSA